MSTHQDQAVVEEAMVIMKREKVSRLAALERAWGKAEGSKPAPAGETDAYRTALHMARVLVTEGRARTLSTALARVWDQDPDLVKRHQAEKRARIPR